MKIIKTLFLSMIFVFLTVPTLFAQGAGSEWNALNKEVTELYRAGKYDQAVIVAKKALDVAERSVGPAHLDMAQSLNNLALLYSAQGQYKLAEPLYKRSLEIREKFLGPDHPSVALSLNNVASLYVKQAQYAQAEPLFKRALAIYETALGTGHTDVALSLNNLALLYSAQGQYAQAEPLAKRSLAIREKALGADHSDVALSLASLASLYDNQGQYALAEPLYERSLAIYERALGADHPYVAQSLLNLAFLYSARGQYVRAEPLYKRSLAIWEGSLGPDHPSVAGSLNNLAALYKIQGQYARAEPLFRRSLAIYEKTLGPDHTDVARSLNNLAALYDNQGRYAQAEPLYKRSLAIHEKALGLDHPNVAVSLNNLAELYRNQGQYAMAEPLYKQSLAIKEKALGLDHPDVALSLNNLAGIYVHQGWYAQAEPVYQRSLTIREMALGPDHPDVALSLNNLALLYYAQGQFAQALAPIRRSSTIYRKRIVASGSDDASTQESTKNRTGFIFHLSLLSLNPDKDSPAKIADESFQIVQLEQASGTGAAVAKMAVRFAKGDDTIASLVKRKQDTIEQRAKGEVSLVRAAGQPPDKRNAATEQKLREEIARIGKDIDALDAELNDRFPEYQELTRPEPLSLKQVQAMLRANEAMLVYSIAEKQSWLWVVRADKAEFISLKADQKTLSEHVRTIRAQMEVNNYGRLAKVDVARLHEIYQSVFAPALPYLAGAQHLMIVPAGPLQSLPFGLFVASPPKDIQSTADYREVDWLIKRYALSVLPSVTSIRAFRQFTKSGVAQEPFIGFGDPLLADDPSGSRAVGARVNLAGLFRNAATQGDNAAQVEIADVKLIKQQARLPETADELKAMARIVKAGPNSIWLQDRATETNVKKLDLSKYRTLAFATHGVMAGEIGKGMEPGLIMTPPALGTVEDDGYLTAGEIARLKLNADWVLLSACNTAAADGTPGAEGMSGLAKAFFYAGSRALLVSHWLVASEATVPLTTFMLREYETNPGKGKAEAHRKAMLALMNTPNHPEYAHPMFWAPFVVVGEGGAGIANQKLAK